MMQQSNDLEFNTSVDYNVQQNVPIPPQTNSVLSGMIASAEESTSSPTDPSQSSSYTPGTSTLPSALQFSKSSHPTACLFHILFKGLALTIYIMGSRFGMEDIMVTVICILLLAADFWVVKNISGRLLVGLRWWNKVDPVSGATSWIFESAAPDGGKVSNAFDSKFFWGVLYLSPLLWGIFSISAILFLRFNCFVTLATAMVLACSNVYGYYKCSADQRQKVNEWMNYGAQSGMNAMLRNPGLFGRLGSVFGSTAGRQQVPQQEPNTMQGTFA